MVQSRRAFLRFVAGSPLLALLPACADDGGAPGRRASPDTLSTRRLSDLVRSPDDALNVFDFEAVARETLPPAHWGYLATGVEELGVAMQQAGIPSVRSIPASAITGP